MRLICPNCGAQYAIDDGLIPETGREVQCSACGTLWFQEHSSVARGPAAQPAHHEAGGGGAGNAFPPSGAEAPRKPIDEAVLSVLREEAAREQDARRAERELPEGPDKSGADMLAEAAGEDLAPPASVEATPSDAGDGTPPPKERLRAVRRETLPDAEEITSTLRPPANSLARPAEPAPHQAPQPRRRYGVALAILLFAGLTALYAQAERVSRAVPPAAPMLTDYVRAVDSGRLWLHDRLAALRPPAQ